MSYDFYTTNNFSDATTVGALTMPNVFTQADDIVKVDSSGALILYTPLYVNGPASSVVNQVPTFSDVTGKVIQASSVLIDESGKLTAADLVVGVLAYPSVDGLAGSVLTSDGSGALTLQPLPQHTDSMVYGMLNSVQAAPVVGDHIKFANVMFTNGALVNLDTTTAYSSAANVASMGRFTLTSGHTYKLEAELTNFVFNKHTGSVTLQWYDSDGNSALSQPIVVNGIGGATGAINYGHGHINAFITTVADTRVELRVTAASELVSFNTCYSNAVQFL